MRTFVLGIAAAAALGCARTDARDRSEPAPPVTDVSTRMARLARARAPLAGLDRHADVTLALGAADATFVRDVATGLGVAVRLRGARGVPAQRADERADYPEALGPGTYLTNLVGPSGFEDFVGFERRPSEPRLAYDVDLSPEVAGLRLVGDVLEVLDRDGTPRLRAAPPYVLDAEGKRHPASLDVHGCAVDRDARPPWGRAVTAPGAGSCGVEVRWAADLAYPAIVDPAWTTTGAPLRGHASASVIRYDASHVLVSGGTDGGPENYGNGLIVLQAEVFDLGTGTFAATGSTTWGHWAGGGALLDGGTVMLAGGYIGWGAWSGVTELWSPATGTWKMAGKMLSTPATHAMQRLASGHVLAVGCEAGGCASETYDPVADVWTATANTPSVPRSGPTMVSLKSGKILVSGGRDSGLVADLWDPTTRRFTRTADTKFIHGSHAAAARLASGDAMLLGGYVDSTNYASAAERFDATTETWSTLDPMPGQRSAGGIAQLPSGTTLYLGGFAPPTATSGPKPVSDVFAYDPTADKWSTFPSLLGPRAFGMPVVFPSGAVLILGGFTDYDPFVGPKTGSKTAELNAQLPNGAACTGNTECASVLCIDGVCCNSACKDACSACDLKGSLGTCSPVVSGPPRGARSCGDYGVCSAGACASSCALDADCAAGRYCDALGRCKPKKPVTAPCGAAKECANGTCVDGFCCESACTDVCAACDIPGKQGLCSPTFGVPRGGRKGCVGVGLGTTCGTQCNGIDTKACTYPDDATGCGASTCIAGVERHPGRCDGKGACNDTPKSCGAYGCGAAACLVACASSDECGAGFYCKSGACVPAEGAGGSCTGARGCAAGLYCTDGVCCDKSDCGAGSSCGTPEKKGTCAKTRGTACGAGAECATGFCVDGVCCESACAEQCAACAEPLQLGRCIPVSGKPRGTRTACDGGSGACTARACDGTKDTKSCAAFLDGTTVTCAPARCSEDGFVPAARCDGAGTCALPPASSCGNFACTETGCKRSCDGDADCAAGFRCDAHTCIRGAACTGDKTGSIAKQGGDPVACAPYYCGGDGLCRTTCATSSDCQGAYVCDVSTKTCAAAAAGAASNDGGCALGAPHPTSSSIGAGLVALLGLLRRLRKRGRGSYSRSDGEP